MAFLIVQVSNSIVLSLILFNFCVVVNLSIYKKYCRFLDAEMDFFEGRFKAYSSYSPHFEVVLEGDLDEEKLP